MPVFFAKRKAPTQIHESFVAAGSGGCSKQIKGRHEPRNLATHLQSTSSPPRGGEMITEGDGVMTGSSLLVYFRTFLMMMYSVNICRNLSFFHLVWTLHSFPSCCNTAQVQSDNKTVSEQRLLLTLIKAWALTAPLQNINHIVFVVVYVLYYCAARKTHFCRTMLSASNIPPAFLHILLHSLYSLLLQAFQASRVLSQMSW